MEYPKKFPACPVCGSINKIVEQEVLSELAKGNVKSVEKIGVISFNTTIFDPSAVKIFAPVEFPVITTRFDVCADCGILYCVEVERTMGKATPEKQGPRRDNFRGNMPFMGQG